jgi:ketol-acid reductoisomerase
LREIRSGKFARGFIREMKSGRRRYAKLLAQGEKKKIETVGRRLRALMNWKRK